MGSAEEAAKTSDEIDDSLYSRQRYVLGDDAMKKLSKANVFIMGMDGLGIEIAKNVVLSGVKSVTIQDSAIASVSDLGLQFFLRKEDVDEGKTRATGCIKRLAELNPHVTVAVADYDLEKGNFEPMKEFQCVVLIDCPLGLQLRINNFCREQNPAIKFISTSVFGVYSSLICDFGSNFQVTDVDGLEPLEFLVGHITQGNPAIVTTLDCKNHQLQTGDVIALKEVNGMTEVNGKFFEVKDKSRCELMINCDATSYNEYTHGGIALQRKQSKYLDFKSLQSQLKSPDLMITDYIKSANSVLHLVMITSVYKFLELHGRKPDFDVDDDYIEFCNIANSFNEGLTNKVEDLSSKLNRDLVSPLQHQFAPLCATLGGIAAQEVLKAVTGKFSPLKQWLLLDARELIGDSTKSDVCSRYSPLRGCIGKELSKKLANTRLFMVGCGAIGCEMLKNFALLGIGSGENGKITITDNDLIEKSNLNRQFLFRQHHIQKAKSVTAANSAKEINGDICIKARQDKVWPATEHIFNNEFFESCDIIVNALDNIEARRYVDSRCVANRRPLIETGTLGPMGHVQVIIPFMTESYANLSDPEDQDIPYCTLKSFPQSIEHTIQWARDKFGSCFSNKPSSFNKFWEKYSTPKKLHEALANNEPPPDAFVPSMSLLKKRPKNWKECIEMARIRFEKYFNHMAKQLLHVFPLDHTLEDGSMFWQSPKRPPKPIEFDVKNQGHIDFIDSTAKLIARIYGVEKEDSVSLKEVLLSMEVPKFSPSNKAIAVDDEEAKKSEEQVDAGKVELLQQYLKKVTENNDEEFSSGVFPMFPEIFEKDDDSNSHIDFITAASNLRAEMYNIESADRYKTKRIAGKIIPAIATTTAAIAGLATTELIKAIDKFPMEEMRNYNLNLAVPMIIQTIPMSVPLTEIKDGVTFSTWDRWDVEGNENYTLQQLLDYFKDKYDLVVSMVMQGEKIIYIPFLNGHNKKPPQRMIDLLKPDKGTKYIDLTLGFESKKDDLEELPCPPVRYIF